MWKLTAVLDAPPVIVFVADNTCLQSMYTVVLAAIVVVVCKETWLAAGPIPRVKV